MIISSSTENTPTTPLMRLSKELIASSQSYATIGENQQKVRVSALFFGSVFLYQQLLLV